MIRIAAHDEEVDTVAVTGDVTVSFPRTYLVGDLLAFSDGTVVRASWPPVGGVGMLRLAPARRSRTKTSSLQIVQADEFGDRYDGDVATLDADVTWVVMLAQPDRERYAGAPVAADFDRGDVLGVAGGPWRVETVMRLADEPGDEMGPWVMDRTFVTLREAHHVALNSACLAGAVSVTVRGADGHVAAFWTRATNLWLPVTEQSRWVERMFHDEKADERARAGTPHPFDRR